MRVEEEADVKEEDIPVAVKFSTAKVKCRSHFDQATQCCCIPHYTILELGSTDDSTLLLATHSSSDFYCS